ncbi:MAG: hypothetical protein IJ489_06260 [Clostridia bacterium]|nr:hypothetical protein [Clostridia bacterium]
MFKRIISLGLCLAILAGTLLLAGCNQDTTSTGTTNTDDLPATINLVGITEQSTTAEAIDFVEEALNKLTKTRFKTKVELTLVTADEYIDLIESRVAEAEQESVRLAAIGKYNSLAQKEANNAQRLLASQSKKTSKWTKQATTIVASTLSTGDVYSAEETTVYEDGKIETLYPAAVSPIDILMIDGKEMYDYLDGKDYLLSIEKRLESEFTKFRQYIYPTFFDQLKVITGDIKAIPNNNLLAEYTYLVVEKELADKYEFNIDDVDNYADLESYLAEIKANESVAPLATTPDALGIYQYFEDDIAVGTYYDPIYGYNTAESTDFTVQNLLAIPQYQQHVALMQEYAEKGYIVEGAEEYAVNVIKGNALVESEYGDDYYVKALQYPFVEMDAIFNGMFAVSSYSSNDTRALEVIELLNTDPEAKNIFQYGIAYDGDNDEYANYRVNNVEDEDGYVVGYTIERLNNNYMMDNALTGNVYMGYPEEGQVFDIWDYYKQTNLDSNLAPFMHLYVGEEELDSMLSLILKRAALTEAFDPIGIDYDEYDITLGTNQGNTLRRLFKTSYIGFFMSELDKEGLPSDPLNLITKGAGSKADQEFILFAQSKEGQEIILNAGYASVDYAAAPYEKVDSLEGKIVMCSNIGSVVTYLDTALAGLVAEFQKMYPDVEIVLPEKDDKNAYNTNLTTVGGSATLGIAKRALLANEINAGLSASQVGKDYFAVFNLDNHANYPVSWYENKMVAKITAEKYADIVSASGLNALVADKVASIAGIDINTIKGSNRPASNSIVLANAKKSANNYYTNIEYLRIMAEILLFEDLSPSELAKYDAMTVTAFESAVFDYVRANYETENNLTEEDYVKRVQDFMVSVLEYTSPEDKSQTYLVTWDDFIAAEEAAQLYLDAAGQIKTAYNDKLLTKYNSFLLNMMSLDEIIDVVYEIMYEEYLAENGLEKADFEASVKNQYLEAVGTNAEDFATYAKTSDEYKNYVAKLRKKYKDILVAEFSLTEYKNGEKSITNDEVLDTLYNYFLEETLGIYDKMCETVGVNVDEFLASEEQLANYDMYIGTLKTKYVYTLRTKYKDSEINNWSYEEAKNNIYGILYDTGFYTNELAKYIGLTLSEYMLAKSNAVDYQNYIQTLANELSDEIKAMGYDPAILVQENGDKIEELAAEIVREEYFSDKVSIQDVMLSVSGDYMKGLDDADDLTSYMKESADAISDNYFFMAVVNELQATWEEVKAKK